jgi:hypothetical protein
MPLRFQQRFSNVLLGHDIVTVKDAVRFVTADLFCHLSSDASSRHISNARAPKVVEYFFF